METVTIPKEEYDYLKSLEKIDWQLVQKFKEGLDDVKDNKLKRIR